MMTRRHTAWSSHRVVRTAYLPAALCILLISVPSCGKDSPTNPESGVPVRIALSPAATTLTAVGETVQLTTMVLDREGKPVPDAVVTWTSSNPSVVKVDDRGLATSRTNGYVQITADTGQAAASASIVVAQAPARIEVMPPSSTLSAPGETIQLVYTVYDGNDVPIPGSGALWSSGDDTVATVSINGLVTAVGRGSTRITASSGGVEAGAVITVAHASGRPSIVVDI